MMRSIEWRQAVQCALLILRKFTRLFDISFDTSRGLSSSTVLSVACPTELSIATHHVPGFHLRFLI